MHTSQEKKKLKWCQETCCKNTSCFLVFSYSFGFDSQKAETVNDGEEIQTSSGEKFVFYFTTLSGTELLAILLQKKMVCMKMVCEFVRSRSLCSNAFLCNPSFSQLSSLSLEMCCGSDSFLFLTV